MQMSSVSVSTDTAAIAVSNAVGLGAQDLAVALLEQSDDCIKILGVAGHLEFMNCAGLRAMEIDSPTQFIGKLWWDLWPAQSRERICEEFKLAAAGSIRVFVADCPTAKGSARRWSVNLKPLVARAGPVVSILCTSRDITKPLA